MLLSPVKIKNQPKKHHSQENICMQYAAIALIPIQSISAWAIIIMIIYNIYNQNQHVAFSLHQQNSQKHRSGVLVIVYLKI